MLQMVGHYRTPLRARAREPSNFELDGARADAATSAKATASRLAHDDTASQRPDGVGQLPRADGVATTPAPSCDRPNGRRPRPELRDPPARPARRAALRSLAPRTTCPPPPAPCR